MNKLCPHPCLHRQKEGCALHQMPPSTEPPKEVSCPYYEKTALSSLSHQHRS